MKCIKAEQHPNADALRLYEFSCPQKEEPVQIIANLENVYEVGDVVTVVLAGSILKDGTVIKPTKLRGVASYGMAMGHTEAEEGTDLTVEFCQLPVKRTAVSIIPWPDIKSLFNVRKYLKQEGSERVVTYKAKVKLHGSNAGVQLLPSNYDGPPIIPQSRSRIIDVDNDNLGFARFVVDQYQFFLDVRKNADELGITDHITIFGEFSGNGIQKGTAINQINGKILAIFAIQIGILDAKLETDPEKIRSIIFGKDLEREREGTIKVLPWESPDIECDFTSTERLDSATTIINQKVHSVEECDPWVKETFGIEGLGEGVVMYPIIDGKTLIDRMTYTELVFKAKGKKHQVVNVKKPVQIDPEVVATIDGFVNLFVTENRLNQIAQYVGDFDMKNIGTFLKEFNKDVHKESVAELEAANLEWKQVVKAVGDRARNWWMNKCNGSV